MVERDVYGKAKVPKGTKADKPDKPYEGFPLFAHSGRWAKSINGKRYYFGPWGDWEAALAKYMREKDFLFAGLKPPDNTDSGITLKDLCNAFLSSKDASKELGELSPRTYHEYKMACRDVLAGLGGHRIVHTLEPRDFEALRTRLAHGRNATTLSNAIQRTRTLFKYAYDQNLIDRPLRFGGFRKPNSRLLRRAQNALGRKDFSAEEINCLLIHAPVPMRAMILLGVNCGLGNEDCSLLTQDRLDLENGWHMLPRQKTEVQRRCPLWPETIAAVNLALAERPGTKDEKLQNRVFLTRQGNTWVQHGSKGRCGDRVTRVFLLTKRKCGINRAGVGFYGLRRTHETVGDAAKDPVAMQYLMGHAPKSDDMAARYRQGIEDDRLVAVTDHIRSWLFGFKALNQAGEAKGKDDSQKES